jgi:type IV secretory pathway component VirB8
MLILESEAKFTRRENHVRRLKKTSGFQMERIRLTGKSAFIETFLLGLTVAGVMALATTVVVMMALSAAAMTMVSVVAL